MFPQKLQMPKNAVIAASEPQSYIPPNIATILWIEMAGQARHDSIWG